MARYTSLSRLIVMIIVWVLLCSGQSFGSASTQQPETADSPEASRATNSPNASRDPIILKFSREEADSVVAALPDGKARQIFKKKVTKGREPNDAFSDESIRSGEEFALLFYKGEKAFTREQGRLVSFFNQTRIHHRYAKMDSRS